MAMAMAMFETWTIEGSVSGVDDSNGGEGESWETTSAVGWERVGSSLERLGSTDEFPPDQTLDSVFLRIMENEKKTEKEKEKDWGGTNVPCLGNFETSDHGTGDIFWPTPPVGNFPHFLSVKRQS
ncbi:hypothetical protein RHMOL_Rhmol07G0179900 [Rhododendron molle]|uniref:Uncharacterized protein n=1 Tax=Rhododendron molle TaxID=49168 RepID=A0ACC0N1X6_RHOML|nr:hypothetical protein RHMOL_Rhmol07G0179900 [Rhododendron molle]